jgi:hypothetical protein
MSKVISLDSKNTNGKINNLANNRMANIHFHDLSSFLKAKKFLGTEEKMTFIGCPLIEYDSFDPQAGDIHFIDLV